MRINDMATSADTFAGYGIWKVQKPLSDPTGPWLLYKKGRRDMTVIPFDEVPQEIKFVMRYSMKNFIEIYRDGETIRVRSMPDQRW